MVEHGERGLPITYVFTYVYVLMCVCVNNMRACVWMQACVCMFVCMYVSEYV